MKSSKLSSPKYRFLYLLLLLLTFCTILPAPACANTLSSSYPLGQLTPSALKLTFEDVTLNTYEAYGIHYVATAELKQLGFHLNYIPESKIVNIMPPSVWGKTTTSAVLKADPSSYTFFNGEVYLGNFKTQCLVSQNSTFIPVGALNDLGNLILKDNACTFVPGNPPPVKATEKEVINLTDTPVTVTLLDIYFTDHLLSTSSTYTLASGETAARHLSMNENALHITTLIQSVKGDGISYINNGYRGQVNIPLIQKYLYFKDRTFLDDYGDDITPEQVLSAENFINSKNLSSPSSYLVWTNLKDQRTYIFTGYQNNWHLLKYFWCSTGLDRTPTPKGTFSLLHKVPSFGQAKGYCCKYAFSFIGTQYLYHSIIYDKTGTYLLENKGVLGRKASQGCIRFSTDHAKWFYDTMTSGTTVYIN